MLEQLKARLQTLKNEFNTGRVRLSELEQQETSLRETLLRISGAIQVLEEEIAKIEPTTPEVSPGGGAEEDRGID